MRYFDHNATHPLSAVARAAWLDAVERLPSNPSSPHRWGTRVANALDEAREQVAHLLGCHPSEIVWTSGATESNNAALHHLSRNTSGPVLVSAIEHPAVLAATRRWLGDRSRTIPVTAEGVVDIAWIEHQLRAGLIAGVVVMAANNETGVLQPWSELATLCEAHGVSYSCDAAQWIGKLPAHLIGRCSLVVGCAHKFGGPQGVGFLKGPAKLAPLLVGGPQEEGRRGGTENVAGILSMVAALRDRAASLPASDSSASTALDIRLAWRDQFISRLKTLLPQTRIVGESVPRLWNTVAALMPGTADCRRRWVVKLDRLGCAVSTGSACSSGREQPSHVLSAMGIASGESDRMLRFSAGWETTEEDWNELLETIRRAAIDLGAGPS